MLMKKITKLKTAHTPNFPKATTSFYGSGVKNPVGKSIDIKLDGIKKKSRKAPPKSLA